VHPVVVSNLHEFVPFANFGRWCDNSRLGVASDRTIQLRKGPPCIVVDIRPAGVEIDGR
jgi:hypothetical protein